MKGGQIFDRFALQSSVLEIWPKLAKIGPFWVPPKKNKFLGKGNFGSHGVTMSTMAVTMVFTWICIAIVFVIVTLVLVITVHVAFSPSN